MDSKKCLSFVFVVLVELLWSSQAYKFYVGGKDGWVVNPSERYDHWAERNRFQVNDTLCFKYKKGSDSVLVVTKDDYSNCNTKNPIKGLTEGDSVFSFDRSGAFYFISGNVTHCKHGQKMIVVVLAVRGHQAPPAEIPAKSPSSSVSSPPPIMAVPAPAASSSAALHIFALTSGCSVGLSVYFPFALVGLL